ncbi:aliphatic sulfonate ABC transporter substrate-binding protein [Clostridium beijerinckii]|uniref:Putative aliphatic sulfonates-binding protein n=1 Tax=Clostridium beijerinckii TaxID=1520 RepID=A0A1S8S664_CLOBE|nr:aliphatic sulfonate ABC transporter substrate-binding protein [Clostridium beijerinckii]NRY60058.1 NitT/TauT family transport system substrate-binding protein [Clostridium beijerinckii]OOM60914.1 putative aliphatic sulfonates-binding protein precursor [Clostridium beijerinckii]
MKKIFRIISIIMISLLFISCSKKQENDNTKIRIGYFPNITHSQALLGKAEGKFEKAFDSHEVEWKMFNAGPSEMEAMLAGELDIAYIGPGPAINGYVKSKGDVQIIAGATNAGAILISRKDLKITDLKQLENKKIAVPQFGNTQDLTLRYILKQNGLRDTTKGGNIEIRHVENQDLKVLLEKGDIDAALVPEPWGSTLVKDIGANAILDYNKLWREGNYSTAVVIARKDFIKKYPDLVEKFLKTHVELTNTLVKKDEQTKQTVNNQINELTKKTLAKDVFDDAYDRTIPTYDSEKDSILDFVDLSVEIGTLKEKPDTSKLFDLSILDKVLK